MADDLMKLLEPFPPQPNSLLPETDRVLFIEKDNSGRIKSLVWLSAAEPISFSQTFGSSISSDVSQDDETFSPADLFPSDVPETIDKGKLVGLITELTGMTNSTTKTISRSQLEIHYSVKSPADVAEYSRAGHIIFGTVAANATVQGIIKAFFPVIDGPILNRSRNDLHVRIEDKGTQLSEATASSLTNVIVGNHYAVMAYGMKASEVAKMLIGKW